MLSVGQGSSGDDDRDRDRNNRRYRPLPERVYVDPALAKNNQKEEDEADSEENDPNVKVVWLYPLDKDGNLIIPDDENEGQSSAADNVFESDSNTLFSSDSRRVFYTSPPNNPTGDSVWSPLTDSVTWHSLPLQEIPTVSTYDLDTSFNSLNVSGSSEAAHSSVDPQSSTSTMPTVPSNRPWRSRSYYPTTPMTSSNLSFTTNSASVVTSSSTGANPTPGRYIIPQRRVHFQTTNTTTSEVVYNSGTRTEIPPSEPRTSRQDSNARVNAPQASTSGDDGGNRRETPRTIFFSDTASSSSDSDTNNISTQSRNFDVTVGAPLRRMQVSDSIDIPSGSIHNYNDDLDDVWEPLPPIHDSTNSQQSFDYSQFPPSVNESAPNNNEEIWESNPSEQNDQTESSNTDAYADVSSMLNQSFEESRVRFNRRQNQHDIAPRVKDDRLVIPLFRLDEEGNLIYDDIDENADASESSDESSRPSSIELFAPMDYKFDPVYSPFPSASSSSLSSDEQGDRPIHGPFGIFPPRRPKNAAGTVGTASRTVPQTSGSHIPILHSSNRVQSLFSMAGAEVGRAPRPTPLVSPISSATSRVSHMETSHGSHIDRTRSVSGSRAPHGSSKSGRCAIHRGPHTVCGCNIHGEGLRTSTLSQASTSGFLQPSTSTGNLDLQSHEYPRRRVHFTDPLVMPNTSRVNEEQRRQQEEANPLRTEFHSMDSLDEISFQDLPPLPGSDSSLESLQQQSSIQSNLGSNNPRVPTRSNILYNPLNTENQGYSSDDSSDE